MDQKQVKSASDRLIETVAGRTGALVITGMVGSAGARLAAGIRSQLKRPVLVVAASTKVAEQRQAEHRDQQGCLKVEIAAQFDAVD